MVVPFPITSQVTTAPGRPGVPRTGRAAAPAPPQGAPRSERCLRCRGLADGGDAITQVAWQKGPWGTKGDGSQKKL